MSEPFIAPDRKPPETIEVTARYLETVLDQAHSAASAASYIDVDENGALVRVEDDTTAEAVTRADEVLTQYLREHRAVLGEDPRWRGYYNEFDQADALAGPHANEQRDPVPDNVSRADSDHVLAAHRYARQLEELIADAHEDAAPARAGQYEQTLAQHLRDNRATLGELPYWHNNYADIDRADVAAASARAAETRVAAGTPLIRPDAAGPGTAPFTFGAVPAAAAVTSAVVPRRTR
ncbi:hypothetical protein IU501_32965 [Nocardia otitidiscaviarum]|uniref:hypothetical protein n=1 Tax=Nocardia otitidiscaviarum TaxID=1823 RepID=UPI0004A72A67|nr:hypothetical protein [Nocardia otitidiscaviarum]MBF6137784.1 hypothetical protein [Nocardia otitidiscaviarum]MBF6485307.1 hypothetical protein [Nocardia otitidiscaviarum]